MDGVSGTRDQLWSTEQFLNCHHTSKIEKIFLKGNAKIETIKFEVFKHEIAFFEDKDIERQRLS